MSDDFSIEPAAVRSASRAFAEQEPVPTQLSTSVTGARGVDTGNPGVNAELGSVVDQLSSLLTRYSEVIGLYAQGLDQMVDSYESADADVAGSFDQIQTPARGDGTGGQGAPALTSSLGIAEKLG